MKRFIGGVLAGCLISWTLVFAEQGVTHNGDFWRSLKSDAKQGYVSGYDDAMQVSIGKLDSLNIAAELFHWKGAPRIIRQLNRELASSNVRPEDAVKRLDRLYANQKYRELDLGSAFQLLTMKAGSNLKLGRFGE